MGWSIVMSDISLMLLFLQFIALDCFAFRPIPLLQRVIAQFLRILCQCHVNIGIIAFTQSCSRRRHDPAGPSIVRGKSMQKL